MFETEKLSALTELERIPGVGRKIARRSWDSGYRSIQDLENPDPEELYFKPCARKGVHVDDVCFICCAAVCITHSTRNIILHY